MPSFVIANLDRPGYFWRNAGFRNDNGIAQPAKWVTELDGSYKVYSSISHARRAFVALCKAGYRAEIQAEPCHQRRVELIAARAEQRVRNLRPLVEGDMPAGSWQDGDLEGSRVFVEG